MKRRLTTRSSLTPRLRQLVDGHCIARSDAANSQLQGAARTEQAMRAHSHALHDNHPTTIANSGPAKHRRVPAEHASTRGCAACPLERRFCKLPSAAHPLSKLDAEQRHINVLPVLVFTRHHHVKVLLGRGDVRLSHRADKLGELGAEAVLVFGKHSVV